MRARPLATTMAAAAIAVTALVGLTACSSSSGGDATPAVASEANLSGEPVTTKDDMTALCDQIVAQALPLEAAVALAESSGYTTRVGKIDGEDQALTMDLREDRFTFEVEADFVTACTIG